VTPDEAGVPVIRHAAPLDLASLKGLFRRSALAHEDGRDALLAHPEALEFWFPKEGEWACRVAVLASRTIVGFATSLFGESVVELEDLFVEPEWMRRGVGRLLIEDATALARSRGRRRLEVTANPHALAFYEKTGFITDHPVATPLGDGLRMHLDVGSRP